MKKAFVLLAALAAGVAGCASGGGGGGGGASGGIQVLASGNHSLMKDQEYKDFHNAADLQAYLDKTFGKGQAPVDPAKIDWTQQMVLTAFIGSEKHAGYRIRYLSVDESGDTVSVHIRVTIPCTKEERSPEATQPFTIVAVPATAKPVNVNEPEQEYQKC